MGLLPSHTAWIHTTPLPTTRSLKSLELCSFLSSSPSIFQRQSAPASDGSNLDLDRCLPCARTTILEISDSTLLVLSPLILRNLLLCRPRSFPMDVLPCSLPQECAFRSKSTEREFLRTLDFKCNV